MVSVEVDERGNVLMFDEDGYMIENRNASGYGYANMRNPFTGEWFQIHFDEYGKEDAFIGEDFITRTEWRKLGDGNWYKQTERTYYYNKAGENIGSLNFDYACVEGDNSVTYAYGERRSETMDGDMVITNSENYNLETGWTTTYISGRSTNYDDPWIYKEGEVRTEFYCSSDKNGDGVLDMNDVAEKSVYTWVKPRIVKEVYTDEDGEEISYRLANEDGSETDGIYYNESTGSYCTNTWDDDNDIEYYTFYNAQDEETDAFRCVEQENGPDVWEKKSGSSWTKCTGSVTVWSGSDDKYVLTFDAEGRLTRYDSYEWDVLEDYYIYTYKADGKSYTREYYEESEPGKFEKRGESGRNYLANGSEEYWYIDYYEGYISGSKVITDASGLTQNFNYVDGDWVFSNWSKEPTETLLADGKTEMIYYRVDENGNVTNDRREIRKDEYSETSSYNYNEVYSWDENASAWVGETKYISYNSEKEESSENFIWNAANGDWQPYNSSRSFVVELPDFEYVAPVDPADINDDYFVYKSPFDDFEQEEQRVHLNYRWNEEAGGMALEYGWGREYIVQSPNILFVCDYSDNGKMKPLVVDDQRRVVAYDQSKWTYDEKGMLKTKTIVNPDYTVKYEYNYADVPVWNGIEDAVAGSDATVVEVYNLSGVRVEGKDLPAGVYIVRMSDGSSRKVAVK